MGKLQEQKKEILLVPIGKVMVDALGEIAVALRKAYKIHTHIGRSEESEMSAYSDERRQYIATQLIPMVAVRKRENLAAVLGVVDADMFSGDKSFVFGINQPGQGIAVVALARLREEFYKKTSNIEKFYRRAVTEAIYQVGLSLGLPVCTIKNCVMQGSTTLWRLDDKTQHLCSLCQNRMSQALPILIANSLTSSADDEDEMPGGTDGPANEALLIDEVLPNEIREKELDDESSIAENIMEPDSPLAAEAAAVHAQSDEEDENVIAGV